MPGETGNTIIAGHRDTHFRFLKEVKAGELLGVESSNGQKHLYKVLGADVVDSRKGSLVLDTEAAMLTLVTCYPFDARETAGPLRYIVTAKMLF
jgi:sortase A